MAPAPVERPTFKGTYKEYRKYIKSQRKKVAGGKLPTVVPIKPNQGIWLQRPNIAFRNKKKVRINNLQAPIYGEKITTGRGRKRRYRKY